MDQVRGVLNASRSLSNAHFALFIIDVLMVSLIGYWLNDYHDKETDRVNQPQRFLVQFSISNTTFFSWIAGLSIIGFAITCYLGITYDKSAWVALFPIAVCALFAYARWGKKWGVVGNVFVSLMVAVLPLLILLSEDQMLLRLHEKHPELFGRFALSVVALIFLIFLLNLAREVAKDAEDANGDRLVGSNSLPIRYGFRVTGVLIMVLLALTASVQWCLFFFLPHSVLVMMFSVLFTVAVALLSYELVMLRDARNFRLLSLSLKLLMFIGLLELIFIPVH